MKFLVDAHLPPSLAAALGAAGHDAVHTRDLAAPAAVRYAWAMNPVTSVENGAGLPLLPFRTDTASEQ